MISASMCTDVILGIIRGELPLSTLEEIGVNVIFGEQSCEISAELPIIVNPSAYDIAHGILTYLAKPNEMSQWALFLMGASQIIDFEALESHPQGDLLIGALWDASFEGRISNKAVMVAESLV